LLLRLRFATRLFEVSAEVTKDAKGARMATAQLKMVWNEHKHFLKQLRGYIDEFDAGRTAIAIGLLQFLEDWLKMHLEETDRQYMNFLHSKGVR
jgi:hemerythrin